MFVCERMCERENVCVCMRVCVYDLWRCSLLAGIVLNKASAIAVAAKDCFVTTDS